MKQNNNIYLPTGIYNKKNKIYFLIKINIWLGIKSGLFTRLKNIYMYCVLFLYIIVIRFVAKQILYGKLNKM